MPKQTDSSTYTDEVKDHRTLDASSNLSRGDYADSVESGRTRHQCVCRRRKSGHKNRRLRDIIRSRLFVFFLLGVAVVAVMIFLKVGLPLNDDQSVFKQIETNSLQVEKDQVLFQQVKPVINHSLTYGWVQSKADKALSVDSSSFLFENVETLVGVEVPIIGLEKEIQMTIDAMLADPGKALEDIQAPVLNLPQKGG